MTNGVSGVSGVSGVNGMTITNVKAMTDVMNVDNVTDAPNIPNTPSISSISNISNTPKRPKVVDPEGVDNLMDTVRVMESMGLMDAKRVREVMQSLRSTGSVNRANTLDIFTDASLMGKIDTRRGNRSCAGAIAIGPDGGKLLELHQRMEGTNTNEAEMTGIALALDIVKKYQHEYQEFNIYSDSLLSIRTFREWIFEWVEEMKAVDATEDTDYEHRAPSVNRALEARGSQGLMAFKESRQNSHLILSIVDFIVKEIDPTVKINFIHCNSHINEKNENQMRKAFYNLYGNYKTIRSGGQKRLKARVPYVQQWNDYIDRSTRMSLKMMVYDVEYTSFNEPYRAGEAGVMNFGRYEEIVNRNLVMK